MRKSLCTIILFVLILSIIPTMADAVGAIDSSRPIMLTVQYDYTSEASVEHIPNAQFDLYLVADLNSAGTKLTLTQSFASCAETVTNLDQLNELEPGQFQTLASDLKTLVQSKALAAYASGQTDDNGCLVFPVSAGKTLTPGLYLVVGHICTYDGYTYTAVPALIMLPNCDNAAGKWVYDMTIEPKVSRYKNDDAVISVTVTKKWDVKEGNIQCPSQVTVHLCNGSNVFKTVTLCESNNWTYTWNNLSRNVDWLVTEEPVKSFSASIQRTGNTFVITNTYSDSEFDDSGDGDNKTEDSGTETGGGSSEKLPQTGVLWWPVPLMAVIGIAFIIIGCEMRKKNYEKPL